MATKTKTTSENKEIKKALAQLADHPALLACYDRIRTILNEGRTLTVARHIEMGFEAKKAAEDAAFGEGAIELLAAAVGSDSSALYKAISIVKTFEPAVLEEFKERRSDEFNLPIGIGHVHLIVSLPTDNMRRKAIEAFYKYSLSTRDMAKMCKKWTGRETTTRDSTPKDLLGYATAGVEMLTTVKEKLGDEFDKPFFGKLKKAKPGDLNEDEVRELRTLSSLNSEIAMLCTERQELLEGVLGKMVEAGAAAE
jgi:hypothetical protein